MVFLRLAGPFPRRALAFPHLKVLPGGESRRGLPVAVDDAEHAKRVAIAELVGMIRRRNQGRVLRVGVEAYLPISLVWVAGMVIAAAAPQREPDQGAERETRWWMTATGA